MAEDVGNSVSDALRKKALGFETEECVEEYAFSEGEVVLSKKKVVKKSVPPDVSAIKMLLDMQKDERTMSDEELEKEKKRLLKMLKEINEKEKNLGKKD